MNGSGSKSLDIKIMGREFRVACTEEEQPGLLAAVEYLDKKMSEIRDGGKVIGAERVAIMAALNITHEFLSAKVGGGFDIAEYQRRMSRMSAAIDEAMSDQESLF
ncbi:MAG TPA: cell division protein ZapA [Burkholderiales bacterium]|nr:cell division protein ZapA [Burkholderiales bacterium]